MTDLRRGAFTEAALVSNLHTADGRVEDQAAADITGIGWIVGWDFTGTNGDRFEVHDGTSTSGAKLLDQHLSVEAKDGDGPSLSKEAWVRYTNGFYLNVTLGGTGTAVFYYRPDTPS